MTRVALVGCGAWGRNLLRVLAANPRAEVVAVADPRPSARTDAAGIVPGAALVSSLDDAIGSGIDAVLIATPSPAHGLLALAALDAGLDVFVEKPLAMSVAEADRCAAKATALGRVAMVGHLLRYHPGIVKLIELARSGALGRLVRVEAERLSVSATDHTSALWALGPHDLSVLCALDPSPLTSIELSGSATGDRAVLDTRHESALTARIVLSRANATKERHIRVVGASAVALFDDVRAPDRVRLCTLGGALIREIRVPWNEPLTLEIEHFLACVEERNTPLTSLDEGLGIVRILAAAERRRVEPDLLGSLGPLAAQS